MDFPVYQCSTETFPSLLREIPDPPKVLYARGILPPHATKLLAVVGSRDYTNYGKQVAEHLIGGLRGYPIAIISGLALGIDGIAHEAALETGLYTLAVPGSGIADQVLYPAKHRGLAQRILKSGGGLLSEFEPTFRATTWSFPARNRIMAGLSHAVLMIEAKEKSGTLITAKLTTEYNRELLVVPGNIFGENSKGTHQFLKLGATPVTTPEDILAALGIEAVVASTQNLSILTPPQQTLYNLLSEPKHRDVLIRESELSPQEAGVHLMELELKGYITENHGVFLKIH